MKFEGFDFGELLDTLMPDFEGTEEEHLELFHKTLNEQYGFENPELHSPWLPIMREWLGVFVGGDDYAAPLFEGLAQIEDDWTFTKYFALLITYMWT